MTEDDWKAHQRHVVKEMQAFTAPFVTPISYEKPDDVPRLSGTGSFVELFERRFLLTNEHVILDPATNSELPDLAHGLHGTDSVIRCAHGSLSASYPIDCALCPVPETAWSVDHRAAAIQEASITWAHATVPREILFFRGYAQENSSFHFENLLSASTSYATQAMEAQPEGLDGRYFIALHHSPEHAEMIGGAGHLPLPPGFSGSTVWNTRYVECLRGGQSWTPAEARVTGIVCRWRTGDTGIVVLRIEYLRSWALNALSEMHRQGHL
ncbi:hypothetical protein PMNALOAF_3546 [Methylobacterium adhaesivum]|nr:hypothetical protein PMNALOAF_3546 [Methylobacterium adhaesivum]